MQKLSFTKQKRLVTQRILKKKFKIERTVLHSTEIWSVDKKVYFANWRSWKIEKLENKEAY